MEEEEEMKSSEGGKRKGGRERRKEEGKEVGEREREEPHNQGFTMCLSILLDGYKEKERN